MYGLVEVTTGGTGAGAGGTAGWGIAVVTYGAPESIGHRVGMDPNNHG